MEYIRVSAKTVEDAIIEASIQLETSSDNIEYEIVDKGSAGFLVIGRKPAVINARKKPEIAEEPVKVKKEAKKEVKPEQKPKNKPAAKEPKKEAKKEPKKETSKEPVKEAPKEAIKEEAPKTSKKPAAEPKAPIDKAEAEKRAKAFLMDTLKAMNMEVQITTSFDEEDTLNVELSGDEMGVLIGKRGQTLDSIQYLTSLVVNKGKSSYVRVKVDTEDYRRRRKETLENLANNIAAKVRRTRKPVFLEPMNPYERRIIHSALQNNPYVSTHSEGEEPYRKVVVTLKK